jgi:uncharacterized phiE125 gp8 family phage protein
MQRADWILTVAPSLEPVTMAEAKLHCRVDHTDEDDTIDGLRKAARALVEQITQRGVLTQTYKLVLDDWWVGPLWLPMAAPLQSVSTVKYYDASGVLTTLSSANYLVETVSEPGSLSWAPDITLPALQSNRRSAIEVTYVVGWTTAAAVPIMLKQAMLLLIGHWFANREAIVVSVGGTATDLPMGVNALLAPYRVWWRPSECLA